MKLYLVKIDRPFALNQSSFCVIHHVVVSLFTILVDSLLLGTFLLDPIKIFRNPTTFFLIGSAIVDLRTGLVQEPTYATCFMLLYFQHPSSSKFVAWMRFGHYFSEFCVSISPSIVFAFTLMQYIVVASPLKYGCMITKKKAFIKVGAIDGYHTLNCSLLLMGVPQKTKEAIDLFLHSYTVFSSPSWCTFSALHYERENGCSFKMKAHRLLARKEDI